MKTRVRHARHYSINAIADDDIGAFVTVVYDPCGELIFGNADDYESTDLAELLHRIDSHNATCEQAQHLAIDDVCGTPRGHRRHRSRGEKPCEACRLAENAYQRECKTRRKGHTR